MEYGRLIAAIYASSCRGETEEDGQMTARRMSKTAFWIKKFQSAGILASDVVATGKPEGFTGTLAVRESESYGELASLRLHAAVGLSNGDLMIFVSLYEYGQRVPHTSYACLVRDSKLISPEACSVPLWTHAVPSSFHRWTWEGIQPV